MIRLLARPVAAIALVAAGIAVPAAASAHETCESAEDVPFVVEYGSLEGTDQVLCAQHAAGTTALEAAKAAGLETTMTSAAQPMVCRIDGQPTDATEKCGAALNGPGYWAFLVAKDGQPWGYATTGLDQYRVAEGEFVALVYHLMADGQNVPVARAANAETRAAAEVPVGEATHESGHDASPDSDEDSSGFPVGLAVAVVAAVAVAASAVVVARRRAP